MAKKQPSKKTIKLKAWKAFSEYIRRKYSDDNGYCSCVTCGVKKPWKEQQAGHAVAGRMNSVLFNEEVVFPQCVHCNVFMRGNYNKYALFMIDTCGRERFEELLALRHKIVKLSIQDLRDIAQKYTELSENLRS